jgi:hypothetical protein
LLSNCAELPRLRKFQVNQDSWKLNGTYQLVVCVDVIVILAGSVHTIKKNIKFLVFASKQIGLEINADTSKYIVLSQDQDAARSVNIKIENISFGSV